VSACRSRSWAFQGPPTYITLWSRP